MPNIALPQAAWARCARIVLNQRLGLYLEAFCGCSLEQLFSVGAITFVI